MSLNVSFIGLGVMGYPMAGYLAKAGHQVTVYNRTAAKAEQWKSDYRGRSTPTPAQAVEAQSLSSVASAMTTTFDR